MRQFKIRCSAIGKIMAGEIGLTENQSATLSEYSERKKGVGRPLTEKMEAEYERLLFKYNNPELPAGAKTYCQEWLLSEKYNRRKDFYSKHVEKGLAVEDKAIEMLSVFLNEGVELQKNTEKKANDFIEGEYDTEHDGVIYDTKCSWDLFTFPYFDTEIPKTDYYWQLQGYMAITGKESAALVYCLIDTPQPLIQQELNRLYYASGGDPAEWNPEKFEKLAENYKFSDIPFEDKIRLFPVQRDESE
jgi:flagellar hook-basal body complex protein FliE